MDSPNKRQVGGTHYQVSDALQHWDFVASQGWAGYFEGQITKYIERWPLKGGIRDLEKAEHFLQKLISLQREAPPPPPNLERYLDSKGVSDPCLREAYKRVVTWRSASGLLYVADLESGLRELNAYVERARADPSRAR